MMHEPTAPHIVLTQLMADAMMLCAKTTGQLPQPVKLWLESQPPDKLPLIAKIYKERLSGANKLRELFYDWGDVVDEAIGFVIAGNSGSAKTSIACWLAGVLTTHEPMQVIALDPHYNDIWEQVGIKSIGNIETIEAILQWLLDELDQRCERKGLKLPLGQPILVFADEIGACLKRFQNPKKITEALERIGSEARKFGITLIAINQSSNCDDIGISAPMRNNFAVVLLGASARSKAEKWKDTDFRKQHINQCPYPCILTGAIPTAIAIHPTHGSYQKFKKKGNAPLNLLPIKQLPLTIPLLTNSVSSAVSVSSLVSAVSDTQKQLTALPLTSTYTESDLKQLTSSCKLALSEGKSKTYCIENILGFKGREFVRGKELFNQLMGDD
ncbi:MAG: hypothetical protein ACK5QS_11295 [Pseudanabaenaceae cyanobacterium]